MRVAYLITRADDLGGAQIQSSCQEVWKRDQAASFTSSSVDGSFDSTRWPSSNFVPA